MRSIIVSALFALLVSISATAQTSAPIPQNATAVGGFTATGTIFDGILFGTGKKIKSTWNIIVWRTDAGVQGYSIEPSSIAFTTDSDGDAIDALSAAQLYAGMAKLSAEKGTALGYTPSASDCSNPAQASVLSNAGVSRSGSGTSTSFSACGSGTATRGYTVCTGSGAPVATLVGGMSDTVSSGCEATWSSSGSGSGLQ